MKHQRAKRFTAFLLSGALLTTGFLSAMPALTASAVTEEIKTSGGLEYRYIVKNSTSCILKRISDKNSGWTITSTEDLTIPDKIPGTNYVIKELGYQNEPVLHSKNANQTRVKTIKLPKQVETINYKAFWWEEVPALTDLYVNLNTLKSVNQQTFGSNSALEHLYTYSSSNPIETVGAFENYFGLVTADYTALAGDCFKIKYESMNGKLTLLNAVCVSPYGKKLAYEYATKIAHEYGMDASNLPKKTKLEMVYNYIDSHVRYSVICDKDNNCMNTLKNTPLSMLALHSGVCGGYAYTFQMLCKASGLTVTDSPATSEVVCVSLPEHVVNAVRLSAGEGYYMVDCTAGCFMKKGDPTLQYGNMYCYGINTTNQQVNNTAVPFPVNQLATGAFQSGHSFIKFQSSNLNGVRIEIYNRNNPSTEFTYFTVTPTPAVGSTCKPYEFTKQDTLYQFVPGSSYLGVKVGGQALNMNQNSQNVTIGGRTYRVIFEVRNFDSSQPQTCLNSNYYYFSVAPV